MTRPSPRRSDRLKHRHWLLSQSALRAIQGHHSRRKSLINKKASWRSGYAEDCKSLHPGSIPGEASTLQIINSRFVRTTAATTGQLPESYAVRSPDRQHQITRFFPTASHAVSMCHDQFHLQGCASWNCQTALLLDFANAVHRTPRRSRQVTADQEPDGDEQTPASHAGLTAQDRYISSQRLSESEPI